MGILALLYMRMQTQQNSDEPIRVMLLLTTASSWLMLGIKLMKLPSLKALWDEEKKHKTKAKRVKLGDSAENLQDWLKVIKSLTQYAEHLKDKTGKHIKQITSDEELRNLGINSKRDRTYFLLQIERIRAASRTGGTQAALVSVSDPDSCSKQQQSHAEQQQVNPRSRTPAQSVAVEMQTLR